MTSCNEIPKTKFTFIDKHGNTTELTLDKVVADNLPELIGDVHAWIQTEYNNIIASEYCEENSNTIGDIAHALSRRTIGDMIRDEALNIVLRNINDADL